MEPAPLNLLDLVSPVTADNLKSLARSDAGFSSRHNHRSRSILWPHLTSLAIAANKRSDEQFAAFIGTLDDPVATANALVSMYSRPPLTSKTDLLDMLVGTKSVDLLFFQAPIDIFLRNVSDNYNVCYLLCCNIINASSSDDNYISLTIQNHIERMLIFKEILKSYMPKTFDALDSINALDFEFLDHIFKDFFVELLPEYIVDNIMDSFLIEGQKIIFRYGLALLKLFKASIKSGQFKSGREFWSAVARECKNLNSSTSDKATNEGSSVNIINIDLSKMKEYAFEVGRLVLFKAIRPMKIGKSQIASYKAIIRTNVYPKLDATGSLKHYSSKIVGLTSSSGSGSNGGGGSHASAAKVEVGVDSKYPNLDRTAEAYKYFLQEKKSFLTFNNKDAVDFLLDRCLPSKYHHSQFFLAFSTEEHGFGLGQLYRSIENLSPCLVLIQLSYIHYANTTNYTIGFFVDGCLSPPSPNIRGTANTVIFRIGGPNDPNEIHRWCALAKDSDARSIDRAEKSSEEAPEISEHVKNYLFLACREYIQLGSSMNFQPAIRLDQSLRRCNLGISETFNMKKPLVSFGTHTSTAATSTHTTSISTVSHATSYFDISKMEIFCMIASRR